MNGHLRISGTLAVGLLLCFLVGIYLVRISASTDLEGYAQNRNVGYVMDAVWNGNWMAQYDVQGRITSKPPLHTWLTAGFAKIGGLNRVTLTLPSMISIGVLAVLVYRTGRRYFGEAAGIWAAFSIVFAPIVAKHVSLVRTDSLFALATAVTVFAAWRAWNDNKGWTLFWLAAAVATLIKGPLALLFAAAALLAVLWERRTEGSGSLPLTGSHRQGILLFFGIVFGWFVLALVSFGQELFDKMIIDELLGQATGSRKETSPGTNLFRPAGYFLSRFAPFSLPAIFAVWRIYRKPAAVASERRFERFLVCWLLGGITIFSLAAHHRADLLLPLWPAGALLAGREIARMTTRLGERRAAWGAASLVVLLFAYNYWTYHRMPERRAQSVHYSESIRAAALAARSGAFARESILHLDTPASFQMYLGSHNVRVAPEKVLSALTEARPTLVAVENPERYPLLFSEDQGIRLLEVFRWPEQEEQPLVRIYALESGDDSEML